MTVICRCFSAYSRATCSELSVEPSFTMMISRLLSVCATNESIKFLNISPALYKGMIALSLMSSGIVVGVISTISTDKDDKQTGSQLGLLPVKITFSLTKCGDTFSASASNQTPAQQNTVIHDYRTEYHFDLKKLPAPRVVRTRILWVPV